MSLSIPTALLSSLQGTAGYDEAAFVAAHGSADKITSVRFQPQKLAIFGGMEIAANIGLPIGQAVPWCPHGFYLQTRPSFTFDPLFHAGLYYVQEASSMFLWEVLSQTVGAGAEGLRILDLCAAPGGKSTLLASYFQDGLVVSNEVIKSRANILVENITKWGASNTVVTNNDPKDFKRLPGYFDLLMVDAPCSGSGLFRKDASAINEWSEDAVHLCSLRQQRILTDAYESLKEGGWLIYSTCSYSPQENEQILDWAMDNFALSSCALSLQADWKVIPTISSRHGAHGYRFYPDKVQGEGFFIAAFKKNEGETSIIPNHKLSALTKTEEHSWNEWLQQPGGLHLFKQKEFTIAIPARWQSDVAFLQKHLYIKSAGTLLGSIKGKDVIPHHALAMSTLFNRQIPQIILDREQAIRYLQKKEMAMPAAGIQKGWQLALYCGLPLGWAKVLPNRINNYYPSEWRILKN